MKAALFACVLLPLTRRRILLRAAGLSSRVFARPLGLRPPADRSSVRGLIDASWVKSAVATHDHQSTARLSFRQQAVSAVPHYRAASANMTDAARHAAAIDLLRPQHSRQTPVDCPPAMLERRDRLSDFRDGLFGRSRIDNHDIRRMADGKSIILEIENARRTIR